MAAVKAYLGNSVYALWEDGQLTLTATHDPRYPAKGTVILPPETVTELLGFCRRQTRAQDALRRAAPGEPGQPKKKP